MYKTPNYSSLTRTDLKHVYEPAEDTFLFLDALESELTYLNQMKPGIVCEIGSGSGLPITFLAKYLNDSQATGFFATDINMNACVATKKVAAENHVNIHVINCDLLLSALPRLLNSVDVLLFNAPYVVTESSEVGQRSDLSAAWAGGVDGREVMCRLFPLIPRLLSKRGVFYLVCIKPNQIDLIESEMKSYGFEMTIVMNRKTLIENLYILKFFK
jgi:release factor glutamine methyltransferase